jgi:hypothetical protein
MPDQNKSCTANIYFQFLSKFDDNRYSAYTCILFVVKVYVGLHRLEIFFVFCGLVLSNSVRYVYPRLHRIVSFQLIIWSFSENYADLYAGGCRTFSPLFQADRSLTVDRYFQRLTALPGALSVYGEYNKFRFVCGTQNCLRIRGKNLCVQWRRWTPKDTKLCVYLS